MVVFASFLFELAWLINAIVLLATVLEINGYLDVCSSSLIAYLYSVAIVGTLLTLVNLGVCWLKPEK